MTHLQKKTDKQNQTFVDFNLSLGEDGGQPIATAFKIQSFYDIKKTQEFIAAMNLKQPVKNDIIIMIKFKVEEGRQKQSIQYFQRGLDQQEQDFNISAMQKLFSRPKSAGRVQLFESKGHVNIVYRIYEEYLEQAKKMQKQIQNSGLVPQIKIQMITKSSTSLSTQKKIKIKPDYINFSLTARKIHAKDLAKLMLNVQALSMQDDKDVIQSPFFQLFKNLQEFKLNLKFNSLRRILRFYQKIMIFGKKQTQREKQAPLANKGLFRQKSSMTIVFSNKFTLNGQCDYQNEQIFLSFIAKLVRIYQVTQRF